MLRIPNDTGSIVRNAQGHRVLQRLIRTSNPYEFGNPVLRALLQKKSEQLLPNTSGAPVAIPVYGRWNTWRRKVAATAVKKTREFLSSITSTRQTKTTTSRNSSPTVIVGEPRNFVQRFASAVSFAQTAIDDIQSSNRSIMPTTMYEPPCEKSMIVTISPSRTEEIVKLLETGKDLDKISMAEYLQVSFLTLMSGTEVHTEEKIMYGGNVFQLHACVSQIAPGQRVSALRKVT